MPKQGKVVGFGSKQFGKATPKSTTKVIKEVETDGTVVKAAYGTTLSRNYNSVRVDVGIEYPTTRDNIKQAFKEAWDICSDEMADQMDEANAFLKQIS